MASAVALLSGGLDSGVATGMWLREGGAVALCLAFDYGQRSAARELEKSRELARRWSVPWRSVGLPWLGEVACMSGSALVDEGGALPQGTPAVPGDDESAARVWVPARNVVFLAAAAAHAEAHSADCVVAGFNREEAATFPDNSPEFARAMTAALSYGTRNGVRVQSPTIGLDKLEIVAAARELGLGPKDFWSCYAGGVEPCGGCESCARSSAAWSG